MMTFLGREHASPVAPARYDIWKVRKAQHLEIPHSLQCAELFGIVLVRRESFTLLHTNWTSFKCCMPRWCCIDGEEWPLHKYTMLSWAKVVHCMHGLGLQSDDFPSTSTRRYICLSKIRRVLPVGVHIRKREWEKDGGNILRSGAAVSAT